MKKSELSSELNRILGLESNPIDFTPMKASDLQRLVGVLAGQGKQHLKLNIETPPILQRLPKGPLRAALERRPLRKFLER